MNVAHDHNIDNETLYRMLDYCKSNGYDASALEVIRVLLQHQPDSDRLLVIRLAKCLMSLGRYKEAETIASNLNNVPHGKEWLVDLLWGDIFYWSRNFEKADERYNRAIAAKNDTTVAYVYLARSMETQGRFKEALTLLSEAETRVGDLDEVFFHKGLCHRALEQYEDAHKEFSRALAVDPNYHEAKECADDIRYLLSNLM